MAKYTIELRDVVSSHNIFPFRYTFYNESKKPEFEEKFIKHFYFREICTPSIDQFIFFLEDKMRTVFPYYNKLMETALIEYSVTENYDMREETTIRKENKGKTSGESYTVGQAFDEQQTTTKDSRITDSESNGSQTDTRTVGETGSSETSTTGKDETSNSNTNSENIATTSESSEMENGSVDSSQDVSKKFMDTPQGMLDLHDTKYLTTLNLDEMEGNENRNSTKTGTGENTSTKEGVGTSEGVTESNSHSENKSSRDMTENGNVSNMSTGKEETEGTAEGTFSGEHRNTLDNNTRNFIEGTETEVMEHYRHGNIGVMTATDMIEKHIGLQKLLSQIEKNFFDECEDLFMLVF